MPKASEEQRLDLINAQQRLRARRVHVGGIQAAVHGRAAVARAARRVALVEVEQPDDAVLVVPLVAVEKSEEGVEAVHPPARPD